MRVVQGESVSFGNSESQGQAALSQAYLNSKYIWNFSLYAVHPLTMDERNITGRNWLFELQWHLALIGREYVAVPGVEDGYRGVGRGDRRCGGRRNGG